jgi:hypothetical protein
MRDGKQTLRRYGHRPAAARSDNNHDRSHGERALAPRGNSHEHCCITNPPMPGHATMRYAQKVFNPSCRYDRKSERPTAGFFGAALRDNIKNARKTNRAGRKK